MTPDEVTLVLAYASSTDPRVRRNDPVERRLQTRQWARQLAAYDLADAEAAVDRHYAVDKPDALLPGRLRALIRAIRDERLSARPEPLPAADPGDPAAYVAALRAGRAAVASGRVIPQRGRAPLPPAVLEARYGDVLRSVPGGGAA